MSEKVEIKIEERFSATEELTNKISIAFLNEETMISINDNPKTTNQETTTINSQPPNKKTDKFQDSK